ALLRSPAAPGSRERRPDSGHRSGEWLLILSGVRRVVRRSHPVHTDRERLVQMASEMEPTRLRLPDWQVPIRPSCQDRWDTPD
ncbi:MAG: hypothetical protein ACK2T0_09650, partial [Anaerolineales bacterium]